MKLIWSIIFILVVGSSCLAQKVQENDVPPQVKAAMQKQFPSATKVKWGKEDTHYEAEFSVDKIEHSAVFDAQGSLVETEVEIEIAQLPVSVLAYVKANYARQKIKEAAKITDANGNVTFEAEIKKMDLIFDSNGNFVKVVKD